MDVAVRPGGRVAGEAEVPGDKSIAHRWLLLAMLADGRSTLGGLPEALDVMSTARAVARLAPEPHPELEAWVRAAGGSGWGDGVVEARVPLRLRSGHAPGREADVTVTGGSRRLLREPDGEI